MLSLIIDDIQSFYRKYDRCPNIFIGSKSVQKMYNDMIITNFIYQIDPKKQFKNRETFELAGCKTIIGEFDFGYYFE